MTYDPATIVKFAEQLYAKAVRIMLWTSLLGFLLGVVVGIGLAAAGNFGPASIAVVAIVGIIFGAVGYSVGKERAFYYELQAQQALCALQVEINTRPR